MRYMIMGVAAAGLLVAGCSKKDDAGGEGGGTAASTAAASGPPVKREPGKWSMSMDLVKLDVPGAPAEMKQEMEKVFSSMQNVEQCITAEQVAQEDIEKSLSNAASGGGECSFDKKVIAGEAIDVAGTCKQGTQTANITIKGTSGKTAQDIQIVTTGTGPDGKSPMTMELRMKANRLGDC